ncbi:MULTISPECIES: protein-glutamate O-methyltransferase CheR [Oceanobacillus]|uniref:Chemotaxis protein methyltransferase n=1 Tax=Oceanobacillus kimchii TaxID=746691 RepID=A0ABQ5THU3_9BACI|nr:MULTISPECIES: protein-glutamate O-methyltransferase CheR [Oceanobacillus]MBT2598462.1 protein-glutamate O-methyltransferase CheR [Oceanobacillus sp. ISL-74]MBT2651380.1 protein-glutamate O-methyltransferase CheR [Oceanobacillus sp. ISL-73]MCT1576039.1 protein-glutamate O-methyltransferase CheR [Oceanobacillus kimchii]MCT2135676.1 protein-glutamate O-methyltransferase CheR [Oceanobacillus kimchii]GLO66441.1 chemotaxis protein methyltransferase [Oceanobacillus kimchii]
MDDYKNFLEKVHQTLGLDLALYKETQMKRRITTLRDKRGFTSYIQYLQACLKDETLLKEFTDRLTINVSEFYRNPKRWEVLQQNIFPKLISQKPKIKIWSAACSTGEEPYSLAILLLEHFPKQDFEIIATDIDENVLKSAKQGMYQKQSLKELPDRLKNKYFERTGTIYSINPEIKQHITFKRHNLLADAYPHNVDLIVCRNVLIYFTDKAKNSIYQGFSNSLSANGILFVGSTEQIFTPQQYGFELEETFFYKKKQTISS